MHYRAISSITPAARILDGMLGAELAAVVPDLLLAQYRVVLLRPCLCKIHGLSALEVDVVLKGFAPGMPL